MQQYGACKNKNLLNKFSKTYVHSSMSHTHTEYELYLYIENISRIHVEFESNYHSYEPYECRVCIIFVDSYWIWYILCMNLNKQQFVFENLLHVTLI